VHADNQVKVVQAGGLEPLVALLHSPVSDVQVQAARAVANLSANQDNQRAVVEAGALEPLLRCLRSYDPAVVHQAARCLASLALDDKNREEMRDTPCIDTLLEVILHPQSDALRQDPSTLCQLAGAMASLGNNAENRRYMIDRGAIAAAMQLKNDSQVAVVQLQVARALAALADAESLTAADRNDLLVPLTQLSRSADYGVQRYAALGLANLALHDERQVDVIKEYMRLHIEQHADAAPRMNAPQRVPVPQHFNAPRRVETVAPVASGSGSKDSGGGGGKHRGMGRSASAASLESSLSGGQAPFASMTTAPQAFQSVTTHGGSRRRLKDLSVLSDACRRAGRTR
jgi:hypothetical protein